MSSLSELGDNIKASVDKIWRWHQCNQQLSSADCILALGSNDPRVAERAAQLFLDGYASILVFSGGIGRMTEGIYGGLSEAAFFARIAIQMGVPESAVIIEGESTNTGENIEFSRKKLAERGLDPTSFIVVQKPYMEKRSYATFRRHMGDGKLLMVTSPQIPLEKYSTENIPIRLVINAMAGDLQRCKLYAQPQRYFQVPVDIPDDVWASLRVLADAGYTEQMIVDKEASMAAGRTVYEGI